MRLQLLVTLPTIGLVILGAIQANAARQVAEDGRRAQVLAGMATVTSALVHQLERELAETQALRGRGGTSGQILVVTATQRTDRASRLYQVARDDAAAAAPSLRPLLDNADRAMSQVVAARPTAVVGDPAGADERYRVVMPSLLAIADALPTLISDRALASHARAIAALASAKHALAEQRDLLRRVYSRKRFSPGEAVLLARQVAVELERRAVFTATADDRGRMRLTEHLVGPDVVATEQMRLEALDVGANGVVDGDADAWYVASSHTIRRMHDVEIELSESLAETAGAVADAGWRNLFGTIAGTTGLIALTITTTVIVASRTSRRLRRLRRTALSLANIELPSAIEDVAKSADPLAARDARLAAANQVDQLLTGRVDEISEVAQAFGTLQRKALGLAADQALLRRDISAVFEALARRSQTLVSRQLKLLDRLEENETDPDTLDWLYKLDHLAARMRRNDENLLVLAGGEPARRFTSAVGLHDVIRAASAEIEEYPRVEPHGVPEIAIAGSAVGDLVHLLAELLENATMFSAPDTQVAVTANHNVDGLTIAVHDHGLGMRAGAITAVNSRLKYPGAFDAALVGTMGLLVVARLAARHRIGVELRGRGDAGITALIHLPPELLAEAPATFAAAIRSAPLPVPTTKDTLVNPIVKPLEQAPDPIGTQLPRRARGTHLVPGAVPVKEPIERAPLDPDVIRARLSRFASGVAAANRDYALTPREVADQ